MSSDDFFFLDLKKITVNHLTQLLYADNLWGRTLHIIKNFCFFYNDTLAVTYITIIIPQLDISSAASYSYILLQQTKNWHL